MPDGPHSKHGKFRPTLLSLVQANDESAVNLATSRAMDCLGRSQVRRRDEVHQAINELVALRGIGVATGSLLLSVILTSEVPFFSDEAFLWLMADRADGAWDKKIKYTIDEYLAMWDAATALRERLGVEASEVERVGWVLGRERTDLGVAGAHSEGNAGAARAGGNEAGDSKTAGKEDTGPSHGSNSVAADAKGTASEQATADRRSEGAPSAGHKRKGEGVTPVDAPQKRVTRSAKKG